MEGLTRGEAAAAALRCRSHASVASARSRSTALSATNPSWRSRSSTVPTQSSKLPSSDELLFDLEESRS